MQGEKWLSAKDLLLDPNTSLATIYIQCILKFQSKNYRGTIARMKVIKDRWQQRKTNNLSTLGNRLVMLFHIQRFR